MFFRQLNKDLKTGLSIPQYAEELFHLTDRNREFLRPWLPWVDNAREASQTRDFIVSELERFSRGEALHATVFHGEKVIGVVGYNQIDRAGRSGQIGYWLARDWNGRGIMTLCVKDLVELGFEYYKLHRVEIRCAVDNRRSRAVAERLGFKLEGILRDAEHIRGGFRDHALHALLNP